MVTLTVPLRLRAPLVTATGGAAAVGVLWFVDPNRHTVFFPCPLRALLGIDCPLCGGIRAVFAMLHGDLATAAADNVLALVLLPLFGLGWLAWVLGAIRGRALVSWVPPRWLYAAVGVVFAAWMVVRNLVPALRV